MHFEAYEVERCGVDPKCALKSHPGFSGSETQTVAAAVGRNVVVILLGGAAGLLVLAAVCKVDVRSEEDVLGEQRKLAGGDVAIGKALLNFQRVRSLVRVFEVLIRGNVVVMMVMLILQ